MFAVLLFWCLLALLAPVHAATSLRGGIGGGRLDSSTSNGLLGLRSNMVSLVVPGAGASRRLLQSGGLDTRLVFETPVELWGQTFQLAAALPYNTDAIGAEIVFNENGYEAAKPIGKTCLKSNAFPAAILPGCQVDATFQFGTLKMPYFPYVASITSGYPGACYPLGGMASEPREMVACPSGILGTVVMAVLNTDQTLDRGSESRLRGKVLSGGILPLLGQAESAQQQQYNNLNYLYWSFVAVQVSPAASFTFRLDMYFSDSIPAVSPPVSSQYGDFLSQPWYVSKYNGATCKAPQSTRYSFAPQTDNVLGLPTTGWCGSASPWDLFVDSIKQIDRSWAPGQQICTKSPNVFPDLTIGIYYSQRYYRNFVVRGIDYLANPAAGNSPGYTCYDLLVVPSYATTPSVGNPANTPIFILGLPFFKNTLMIFQEAPTGPQYSLETAIVLIPRQGLTLPSNLMRRTDSNVAAPNDDSSSSGTMAALLGLVAFGTVAAVIAAVVVWRRKVRAARSALPSALATHSVELETEA
mmetsp:Transcript_34302/g.78264  ORF Transcript_34302/g.78264 Transcript_34302/m.78264 type:complete len:526 (-) Transcript_34302:221-1798(-)|eukprot:CAMPEP_0114540184 /NCGR_PEP_ID=MMETSP0114-20121206/629_1 /TAXON_ID=31324 /ORGANISM="Goniomonas sp, Strain m" /LENGTH=525 /DNA_ID=CAMNT_0001724323 /DNA_START=81 /DNA_END=1658 /DNA_ORIENTATION=+